MFLALIFMSSCGTQPTPILESTPIPTDVEIMGISDKDTLVVSEILQIKTFNQCESASPFRAQVQFSQSDSKMAQQELVLKATGGGEVGLSAVVKAKIEGAVEQHFVSSQTSGQAHSENVSIEVQAGTHQEYTILWRESRREGTVEFKENGETKSVNYSYRVGLELVSAIGKDLVCPGKDNSATLIPTQTPYPTYTPYPTFTPDIAIQPSETASPNDQNIGLSLGESYSQGNISLYVSEIDYDSQSSRDLYVGIRASVRNISTNKITFGYSNENFILKDNLGNTFPFRGGGGGRFNWPVVLGSGESKRLQSSLCCAIYFDVDYTNPAITSFTFIVKNFSGIDYAEWHIPVNR
jgi:hypothetical protein